MGNSLQAHAASVMLNCREENAFELKQRNVDFFRQRFVGLEPSGT